MNLENSVPREIARAQKDQHCRIPPMRGTWSRQNRRDGRQSGSRRGRGGRGLGGGVVWSDRLVGAEFRVYKMKGVLETGGRDGCTL